MARTSLDKDTLAAKLKDIELLISPKMVKKLTLEDVEALSLFADKVSELLSITLGKLVPNAVKNNKYNAPIYRNTIANYGSIPSNAPVGIASLTEDNKLVISGDMGTGFNAGGISLYDVTNEVNTNQVNNSVIETIKAQNPGAEVQELPPGPELERLADIFASVEDVQQE